MASRRPVALQLDAFKLLGPGLSLSGGHQVGIGNGYHVHPPVASKSEQCQSLSISTVIVNSDEQILPNPTIWEFPGFTERRPCHQQYISIKFGPS